MTIRKEKGSAGILVFIAILAISALSIVSYVKKTSLYTSNNPQVLSKDSSDSSEQEGSRNSNQSGNPTPSTTQTSKSGENRESENENRNSTQSGGKRHENETKTGTRSAEVENEIENEDENENEVKIVTVDGEQEVDDSTASARSHFPLSINPFTRQLIVTTPAGTKVVAILPSQAIENLLENNPKITIASGSATASTSANLEQKDGQLVYRIEAEENKHLLGLFAISIPTTSFVSAQSGQFVGEEKSLFSQLLSLLST